jgi:hypothetical protein
MYKIIPVYIYRRTRTSAEEDFRQLDQFLSIEGKIIAKDIVLEFKA